jgi:hypothetical protein
LAIRTGNAEFSHLLVKQVDLGGLMPEGMHHADGFLWRYGERVPCPTEEAFFQALGLPLVPPAERNADTALRLRKEPGAVSP